jgi:hypothetical protein
MIPGRPLAKQTQARCRRMPSSLTPTQERLCGTATNLPLREAVIDDGSYCGTRARSDIRGVPWLVRTEFSSN